MIRSFIASRHFPEFTGLCIASAVQILGGWGLLKGPARNASALVRRLIVLGTILSLALLGVTYILRFDRFSVYFPYWWLGWGRGIGMVWAFASMALAGSYGISRLLPKPHHEHSAPRRRFLFAARNGLLAAPAMVTGYGAFIERFRLDLREQDIRIPNLPPDLDGLRLVQLTDIHMSPFLSRQDLDRAVAMANEAKADIALVTGDLITQSGDPLDACLESLTRLRATAGVYGCMGNHEIYSEAEEYVAGQGAKLGMRFLRKQNALLRFGAAQLNLAGVDYQSRFKPYLVGAEKLKAGGAVNVLLSHNPDVFPVAAGMGYDLTISGHTHGGQVNVEILHQNLNVARFFTPYVDGLYEEAGASVFVSRGIGTIAMPIRIGAPPEVALLRLRRA